MERTAFVFYKSFYEAIKDLPKDIRLECYTAIMEYALYGREPEALKPVAKGIFTLIKPNIDINTVRYENGKKGGRRKTAEPKPEASAMPLPAPEPYTLTFEQEVEKMRGDVTFFKSVCADFGISADELDSRLTHFLAQCNKDKARKGKERHSSYEDARSHLRYWMSRAYSKPSVTVDTPADYSYSGGFGGKDT